MTTKRLPDSLKEASEIQSSSITNDTFIPLFTKSGNTEVMKKIKASVLNNGGGSSTPSAQPDRVIIIDTTLENNIEGKAYKTFAEAKTYMNENSGYYYQIELPAGEFDEQIILSDTYCVHGNKTVLTQVLDTEEVVTFMDIVVNGLIYIPTMICNCTISGGFRLVAPAMTVPREEVEAPVYILNDCVINSGVVLEGEMPNKISDAAIIVSNYCIIDQSNVEFDGHDFSIIMANHSTIYYVNAISLIADFCEISSGDVLYIESANSVFSPINYFNRSDGDESNIQFKIKGNQIQNILNCTLIGTTFVSEGDLRLRINNCCGHCRIWVDDVKVNYNSAYIHLNEGEPVYITEFRNVSGTGEPNITVYMTDDLPHWPTKNEM